MALCLPQDVVVAGVRVLKLGSSSVTYQVGIFREACEDVSSGKAVLSCWDPSARPEEAALSTPAALGEFVHVFVDRASQRPVPIAGPLRDVLHKLSQTHPKL